MWRGNTDETMKKFLTSFVSWIIFKITRRTPIENKLKRLKERRHTLSDIYHEKLLMLNEEIDLYERQLAHENKTNVHHLSDFSRDHRKKKKR